MRFDNSSHRRLPPSRGKLPIKNNCRLLLPVLGINILSLNFVFVNLSRYVRKALFSLLKGARGSFYRLRFRALFRQPPRFSSNENRSPFSFLRVRTFWRAGVHAAGGTMHRVVFLTLSFKSLLLSVVKQKRTSEFACPFCLAEKQGFEPWLRSSRTTPLAGEPLRPLGYFSLNRKRVIKDA